MDVPRGTKTYPDGVLAVLRGTDWDDLRVFVIVAREGSLGRAVKVLNVAKPTIRSGIENLEASVGTPLFDCRKTGVVLTAQGRQMADMAEEMAMMIGKVFHRATRRRFRGQADFILSFFGTSLLSRRLSIARVADSV